jgi:hypothetical protein
MVALQNYVMGFLLSCLVQGLAIPAPGGLDNLNLAKATVQSGGLDKRAALVSEIPRLSCRLR